MHLKNLTLPHQILLKTAATTWFSLILNLELPFKLTMDDQKRRKLGKKARENVRWIFKNLNATKTDVNAKIESMNYMIKDFKLYIPPDAFFQFINK